MAKTCRWRSSADRNSRGQRVRDRFRAGIIHGSSWSYCKSLMRSGRSVTERLSSILASWQVMESFLSNSSCFLAQPSWERVIRAAIFGDDSLSREKGFAFALWRNLVEGPQLFQETTSVVMGQKTSRTLINELIERLQDSRNNMLRWLSQRQQQSTNSSLTHSEDSGLQHIGLLSLIQMLGSGPTVDDTALLTIKGTLLMCYLVKCRLLYSLAPSQFYGLELECRKMAKEILQAKKHHYEDPQRGSIWSSSMSQSEWIAKGIVMTRDEWSKGWDGGHENVIESWKFKMWCIALGRSCSVK